jgi:hypothetical protein
MHVDKVQFIDQEYHRGMRNIFVQGLQQIFNKRTQFS